MLERDIPYEQKADPYLQWELKLPRYASDFAIGFYPKSLNRFKLVCQYGKINGVSITNMTDHQDNTLATRSDGPHSYFDYYVQSHVSGLDNLILRFNTMAIAEDILRKNDNLNFSIGWSLRIDYALRESLRMQAIDNVTKEITLGAFILPFKINSLLHKPLLVPMLGGAQAFNYVG